LPVPPPVKPEKTLHPVQWGVLAFLLSEVAFFTTLIVTYIVYMGQDTFGPTPREVFSLPLVLGSTICLLASSVTIHLAEGQLHRGAHAAFLGLWAVTILLGLVFLGGTAYEWHELIEKHGLKISTNLFGTTYYTLVGFHAFHVSMGVVALAIVLLLGLRREITHANPLGPAMVSWYWHFVDIVWVVVFLVVYVFGR
jgi:cytochrome c oxidase subunit 3/cytochrome o ubiquinol oxidase subunit 3